MTAEPENDCYIAAAHDCTLRLLVTTKNLLAVDTLIQACGVKAVNEATLAELLRTLRIQCDSIVTHAIKYADGARDIGTRKVLCEALAADRYVLADPDALNTR